MDISTLANSINAIAVTAGVIFAAAQISYYRRRRRRDAMLELVRSFQSPTFSKALRRVMELPDNASAEEIRKILGTDGEDLLVHDFFSGPILISWRKLLAYTTDLRQRYQRETWSEWFQWLAERMMERESKTPAVPAYIAHRDWKKP